MMITGPGGRHRAARRAWWWRWGPRRAAIAAGCAVAVIAALAVGVPRLAAGGPAPPARVQTETALVVPALRGRHVVRVTVSVWAGETIAVFSAVDKVPGS